MPYNARVVLLRDITKLLFTSNSASLLLNALSAALTKSLVLGTENLSLFSKGLGTQLLGLSLVNVFHKHTLVLETVTLGLDVEGVVQVLVNLASLTVLAQKTAEDTHAAHPEDLGRHTGVGSTLSLTMAHMATKTLGLVAFTDTETRLADLGLADDQTILDELTDVGAYIRTF